MIWLASARQVPETMLRLALQVVPGMRASSALDEGDEVASTSLWPFEGDFVAHGVDSGEESDAESDTDTDTGGPV